MNRRIRIWFTDSHCSIQLVNEAGVSREYSAPTMTATILAMPNDDRDTFNRFCTAMAVAAIGDTRKLNEW